MTQTLPLTASAVLDAAGPVASAVIDTPCVESRTLSEITGARVFLKFENLQFTASFKERGAFNRLRSLSAAERAAGVIAASAGNHAQGVAYHAQRLGLRAVIVMPRHAPAVKVARTQAFGAEVRLVGDTFDDAKAQALQMAADEGLTFIHPFDDPAIVAGQGTIGLQMLRSQPQLDDLVVAVGGGGLIGGVALAARHLKPSIRITGVQVQGYAAMVQALGGAGAAPGGATIAEGIAVKTPGELTRALAAQLVDHWQVVSEADIERAILMLLEIEKTVVEGAGAAGLAALLADPERYRGRQVGLILCGGNIDPLVLAGIIQRGMVRSGRLARLLVQTRDIPGMLARITGLLADCGANIEEIQHQRAFTTLPLQNAEVEITIQARGPDHIEQILARFSEAGFSARAVEPDGAARRR